MLRMIFSVLLAVTLAPAPAYAEENAPNILLVNTDDQRPDSLDVMPKLRHHFDDGRTYTRAQVNIPSCCPSRSTLMTGQYPHTHGVKHQADADKLDTEHILPAYLKKAGYSTMMAGKFLNEWPLDKAPPHFDSYATFHGGYNGFNVLDSDVGHVKNIKAYSTTWLGDRLDDFISQAPKDKPWFAYYAPSAPHQPATPEAKYKDTDVRDCLQPNEDDRSDKPKYMRKDTYDAQDFATVCANQLRTLMSVDDVVDRLMDHIDLDHTLVIFTSDNGFLWGEHGRKSKFVPYLPSVQVPLMMRWPGHVSEGADTRLASTVDLAPTILDAAGIKLPGGKSTMEGITLLDEHAPIVNVYSEYWHDDANNGSIPDWASVSDGRWHYAEYADFKELYDLQGDPAEDENVAQKAEFTERVSKMHQLLKEHSYIP
jgi:N-acetylglucosamine-6-sulfatase